MSPGFSSHLNISIRPSGRVRRLRVLVYVLAASGWLLFPVPGATRLVALCLVTGYITGALLLHARRRRVSALSYAPKRGWRLHFTDGGGQYLPLRLPVYVTPWLVIARFGTRSGSTRCLVIAVDSADAVSFRHLRVRLLQSAYGDRNREEVPGPR